MRNITSIGSLTITDGVVSGFSSANYLKITDSFNVSAAQSWEVVYKIKTGTSLSAQSICGHTGSSNYDPFTIDIKSSKFQISLCKNSSSNFLKEQKGTYTVLTNTTYWVKLTFDGSKYVLSYSLDGVDFIEDVVFKSTTKIWTSNLVLGRQQGADSEYPFLGSIDLDESYIKIDDKVWWNGKDHNIYILKTQRQQAEGFMCYKFEDEEDSYIYVKLPIKADGRNSYSGILYTDHYDKLTLEELQDSFSDPDEPNYSDYEMDYVVKVYPDYSIEGTEGYLFIPSLKDSYITGYTPKIGNYTFKKFYNKVLYTCGVASTSSGTFYAYAKTPFKVGDYVYFVGDGSTQATSESDLTQSTSVYITECDDDSFVTEGMVFNGNSLTIGFGPYSKGNITTPVKNSYLLYRR